MYGTLALIPITGEEKQTTKKLIGWNSPRISSQFLFLWIRLKRVTLRGETAGLEYMLCMQEDQVLLQDLLSTAKMSPWVPSTSNVTQTIILKALSSCSKKKNPTVKLEAFVKRYIENWMRHLPKGMIGDISPVCSCILLGGQVPHQSFQSLL